jgi:carboxypeptidase Q
MTRDGLDNVHTERVMVPKWVRGTESAEIVEPVRHQIVMLGLGDSVGTPADGVQGDVLVVRSFEELDAKASAARGRIVLFNVPFTSYGETVRFRAMGPSRAARHGAVAMLVRAVGPSGLRTPHTGALNYTSDAPKIPAAAISTEDADRLQRMTDRGGRVAVRLKMEAHFDADAPSANVVGEIRGRERPDEIVVVSGHLDSWDVGAGATDDGGGCVVTWEALRLMKKLNLRPRRTVRVVLWTNEENGGRGGTAYRDQHRAELARHVLMLESDGGVFRPQGFGFTGSDAARETVKTIATLLSGIAADQISPGGGGADIGPSMQEGHVPGMSLDVDGSKYFLVHHTPADTVDKIDPVEMAKCAAAVAVMAYVVADLPQRLGE